MRLLIAVAVFAVILALSATVVKNDPADAAEDSGVKVFFSADKFDAEGYINTIWDSRVVPSVNERAVDLRVLTDAVKADAEAAGEKYGYRAVAEGNPFNFFVKGNVKIISLNVKSRNGRAEADIEPFDGAPDITLQLGPVYRGTSFRDCLDFVTFADFKNQVEFAKLASQLNTHAGDTGTVPAGLRQEDAAGKVFSIHGAATQNGADTKFNVVPVLVSPVKE